MTINAIDAPEALLEKGIEASRAGKWADAQSLLQGVLNKDPSHTEAMWRLGMAKFFNGDSDAGVELIELSLSMNPDSAIAHNGLGVIFQETDELSKAESHFRRATAMEPEDADFLFNLGVMLLRRGNNADAKLTLKKATERAPDDSDAFFQLGIALRRDGDEAGAEHSLQRAVALDARNGDAYRELAALWSAQNRMNRAYGASLKAMECDGENPEIRLTHGGILFALGGLDDAIKEFESALRVAPEDSLVNTYLGRCYLGLGQVDKAIAAFEDAHRFAPDDLSIDRYLAQARARRRPQWHMLMLEDSARNKAYQAAIDKIVTPQDVVLRVGESTGSGLLAMMAARTGAQRVYTCENDPATVKIVQRVIQRNKLSDTIKVLPTASNFLEVGTAFEDAATVILADVLDSNLLGGGLLPTLRHAVDFLGVENVKVIPAGATIYGQLIEWPSEGAVAPLTDICGFDLRDLGEFRNPYATHQFHPQYETFRALSEPFEIVSFDFSNLSGKSIHQRKSLLASASGEAHAVIVWFDVAFGNDIVFSTKSGVSRNRWHTSAHMLSHGFQVQAGHDFDLILGHTDERVIVDLPAKA